MWKENFNFISLLFLLLIIPQVINSQKSVEENFLRGLATFQQERYDSALISFALSKGVDGKNELVWYYSGKTYYQKGAYADAIADFLEAEKLQPGMASFFLAKTYSQQNNIDKTLEYLEIHLKSNYKIPESIILLDKDLGRFEKRKEWIEFWRESNHYTGFDKLLAEARYLARTENYIEALDILNEGLKKNYRESPLLAKRAGIYILMGNDEPALRDLNKAIASDNRNAELYAIRGAVNYRLGNYKQAKEDYAIGLKYAPWEFRLYPELAKALSKEDMYEEGKENMLYYLNFFPEDDNAWYELGKIHMEAGNYLDALRNLNRALNMNSTEAKYYIARGESYYNSRTYKYADNDLSMALDLEPRNPNAYYFKALTAVKQGDFDLACYCFQKAYRFGKKEAFNNLGKYCK